MSFFHLHQDADSARRVLDEMEHIFAEGAVDVSKEIASSFCRLPAEHSYSWKISRPLRYMEKSLKPVLKKILCVWGNK